jgi:hypothetical protein
MAWLYRLVCRRILRLVWQVAVHPEDLPAIGDKWRELGPLENRVRSRGVFAVMMERFAGFSFASSHYATINNCCGIGFIGFLRTFRAGRSCRFRCHGRAASPCVEKAALIVAVRLPQWMSLPWQPAAPVDGNIGRT